MVSWLLCNALILVIIKAIKYYSLFINPHHTSPYLKADYVTHWTRGMSQI